MNKTLITFFLYVVFFVLGGLITALCYEIYSYKPTQGEYDRMQMYDKSNKDLAITQGVYFPNEEYYCVWVGDRTVDNIQRTDYHEMCHHMVYDDWEHFCG